MGEYTDQWTNTIPRQFDSAVMSGSHVMSFGPVSHYGYRIKTKAHAICEFYKKEGFYSPQISQVVWGSICSQTHVSHHRPGFPWASSDTLYLMLWIAI